jgi:hypothetical protein
MKYFTISHIFKYLNNNIDKYNFIIQFPEYNYLLNKWYSKLLTDIIHPEIIRNLGGINNLIKYPLISYKQSFCRVDYIDNIKHKDINTNIAFGIDDYNRPFIVIKYLVNNKPIIETIFQRFSGWNNSWTSGSCYSHKLVRYGYLIDNGIVDYKQMDNVMNIVKNNFIFD